MVTVVSQIDSTVVRVPRSEFVAGRLSLAFCNTVALPDAADRLSDPENLAGWAQRAGYPLGILPNRPDFEGFRALRAHLRAIFEALTDEIPPPQASLDVLGQINGPLQLVWNNRAGRATPFITGDDLARLRQAIVADAISILTGDSLDRLKRCPADDCRWFFLDTSRNGTRRWCAMADCGTKDKVRQFRARQAAF
nr:CGNR zinc finger domain-containing protein [uncultured Dongia sp.]